MSPTRICHACTFFGWCFFWRLFQLCLHRTAVDNEAEFGRAAASTLFNNFYVDDLLKSVGNINIAKQLVKDVISMLLDVMSFKARADCSCFISKNGMFVQERI